MNTMQPELLQAVSQMLAKIFINVIVLAGYTICCKLWKKSNNRSTIIVDQLNLS